MIRDPLGVERRVTSSYYVSSRLLRAGLAVDGEDPYLRQLQDAALLKVREGVTSFLEKRPAQFTGKVSTDLPDIFPGWEEPEFF